jgi:hypothetical protein
MCLGLYDLSMDIVWSLLLIVGLLLALNQMAGGRSSTVIRPVTGIVAGLISLVVRTLVALVTTVFTIGAGSIKLPKPGAGRKDDDRGPGPPPPRWKD